MNKRLVAFTLIELLVVIAIIGILSGLIVVAMSGITNSANIAKAQIFSNSLRNSLMMNLVSEWKLDETSGISTADSWSGGSTGTLTNFNLDATDGWRSGSDCVSSGCLQFDGSNDYITLSDNNLKMDDITVEFWIKPGIIINGSPIRTNTTNKFYVAFHPDGTFTWHVRKSDNTGSYIYSNTAVSVNKWHHVVGTYKSQSFQSFYLDGLRVANLSNITWSPLVVAGNYGWTIGYADWSASPAFYKGYIDNVRIYNDAMPVSYVREQYYTGLNKLLTSGQVDKKEYSERISKFAESLQIQIN